jgi:hypothetical protein
MGEKPDHYPGLEGGRWSELSAASDVVLSIRKNSDRHPALYHVPYLDRHLDRCDDRRLCPCPLGRRNVLLSRCIVERDWRLRWALGREQDLALKQEKQAGEAGGSTAKFCCHDTPGRCRARGCRPSTRPCMPKCRSFEVRFQTGSHRGISIGKMSQGVMSETSERRWSGQKLCLRRTGHALFAMRMQGDHIPTNTESHRAAPS